VKKVAVGLSGGVDSAVSALLLKKAGFDVVGVHLYCWPPKSEVEKQGMTREEWIKKNGCRADEDRQMALKTALELGILFKVLDFSEEYNQRVVSYFYSEYEAGRTPNPDVLCNSEIKFGLFLDWALENGFDYVATGHYAKLVGGQDLSSLSFVDYSSLATTSILENGIANESNEAYRLHAFSSDEISCPAAGFSGTQGAESQKATPAQRTLRNPASKGVGYGFDHCFHLSIPKDKHKDQTYFLWKLTQKELAHVLFPLGDYLKSEVREMARKANLSVAERKDSQGICFVGPVNVKEFLARRLKDKPGKVINKDGETVGSHDGVWHYTIGERGGWKIDPVIQNRMMKNGKTPILYIVEKNAEKNLLIVGEADEAIVDHFEVTEMNWIGGVRLPHFVRNDKILVRIRHGGELVKVNRVGGVGLLHLEYKIRNDKGCENDKVRNETIKRLVVMMNKPLMGVASGQSAVFYAREGKMLGGGIIT